MSDVADQDVCPEEIELLVFSMMGVRIGVDTAQVAGMLKPEDAEQQGLATIALHERLKFRGVAVSYSDPHVLVIKGDGPRYGIVIDNPEDIAFMKVDSIRPMPDIFALSGSVNALWGAVIRDNDVIFLLDFDKMRDPGNPSPCC